MPAQSPEIPPFLRSHRMDEEEGSPLGSDSWLFLTWRSVKVKPSEGWRGRKRNRERQRGLRVTTASSDSEALQNQSRANWVAWALPEDYDRGAQPSGSGGPQVSVQSSVQRSHSHLSRERKIHLVTS